MNYNFDTTGERILIKYDKNLDYNQFDVYQKNHFMRYQYALNLLNKNMKCADIACGTGYGTAMMSEHVKEITGVDLNENVIKYNTETYKHFNNLKYIASNMLDIDFLSDLDLIISFESLEHLDEGNIQKMLKKFNDMLKSEGLILFSTPYMQVNSPAAIKGGHHKTFFIDERKIEYWLNNSNFEIINIKYQNYKTHEIKSELSDKDFIICVCRKKENHNVL